MVMLQPEGKARKIAEKVMKKTGLDKSKEKNPKTPLTLLMPYLQH